MLSLLSGRSKPGDNDNRINPIDEVLPLKEKPPHGLKFRVSLDYPDPARHDKARGMGNFYRALETMGRLYDYGFDVSLARQRELEEDVEAVDRLYAPYLREAGLLETIHIVSFPDFLEPGTMADVPHITAQCMTAYQTPESRSQLMCNYSKFVLKKKDGCGSTPVRSWMMTRITIWAAHCGKA